jgi:hypothetical protein
MREQRRVEDNTKSEIITRGMASHDRAIKKT